MNIVPSMLLVAALGLPLSAAETPADPGTDQADPHAQEEGSPFLGVHVRNSGTGANFDGNDGLLVTHVYGNTTAANIGLLVDDIVTEINGTRLSNRSDLQKALETVKIGDEVSLRWQRGAAEMSGSSEMQAMPSVRNVSQAVDEQRNRIKELERERAAARAAAGNQGDGEGEDLATAMSRLADILDALPRRLEETATEFKQVYPDGEFTVDITIRIKTSKDGNTIELSPKPLAEDTVDDAGDTPATNPPALPDPTAEEPEQQPSGP